MAVLLISMSIMAIMMTAVLPTWKQLSRREKEAELVFRGEQYARAIQLYQTKAGQARCRPPSICWLNSAFSAKFKDPITNDDFSPLIRRWRAQGNSAPGVQPAGRQVVLDGRTRHRPARRQERSPDEPGAAASGGIMGVTSKSKEQSIRLYKGRNHYNEWQFMPVARVAAPGTGGAAAPGQRGGNQGGQRGAPGTATPPPFGPGRQGAQPRGPNAPNNPNTPPSPFGPPGGRSGR